MAVTAHASNTQSATVGTEHSVASANIAGVFTFGVSLRNIVAGDVVELRVYKMPLTGGTAEQFLYQRLTLSMLGADKWFESIPVANELTDTNALIFSIKQTKGTSRNFDWKVQKYA